MKSLLSTAAAIVLLAGAAPALAQVGSGAGTFDGSIGYTHLNAGEDEFEAELGAVTARVGYRFSEYVGAEAEGSVGVDDQEYRGTFGGTAYNASVGLNYQTAAYAKALFPVSPNVDVFGRVGVGYAEFDAEASVAGVRDRVTDGGSFLAAGAGGQAFIDGVNGFRAEYTRWEGEDDTSVNTASLSYVRKF